MTRYFWATTLGADMRLGSILAAIAVIVTALAASPRRALGDEPARSGPDTLRFAPSLPDSLGPGGAGEEELEVGAQDEWLETPFGDHLLTDVDEWRAREGEISPFGLVADYNRVDRLRVGLRYQAQSRKEMLPRFGARLEYASGRERTLYGAQLEQPLLPPGRLAAGVSMVRRTDHNPLQQVDDVENSLAFLFGRQDYRDYFEREGFGAYLSWRVPDFSTVSVNVRNDRYRSLALDPGTRSFFQRDRKLRLNPPIDDGEAHGLTVRLERLAHRTHRTRAGLYHWIDVKRNGHGLGGDYQFTRMLADVRSVLRLSPATTLAFRGVAGHTFDGQLPAQEHFTAGGVDGLRAHPFARYRGDEMLLGQAEYTAGLWRIRSGIFEGGLHAIAFVDAGRAWFDGAHRWNLARQHFEADGGLGLSSSEDNVRVYVARDLQAARSAAVISMRLQRPF